VFQHAFDSAMRFAGVGRAEQRLHRNRMLSVSALHAKKLTPNAQR
jgi:hypothetical protein